MRSTRCIVCVEGTLLFSVNACAGGVGAPDDDDAALGYYGSVKDASAPAVPGAQVHGALQGPGTLSGSPAATGAYRIPVPRLLPGVAPENVTNSCSKAGYKQMRTLVRSNLNQKPLVAVEVECVLQGQPGK